MVQFSFLYAFLGLQVLPALAFQNCPLLGRDFPLPKQLSNSSAIRNASLMLKNTLDASLNNGTLASNASSFSIEIFSTHQNDSLFTYHHSSPLLQSSDGVKTIDSDSIYRVGSISKLFTAYLFLIESGDIHFNDPITNFVPELANAPSWSTQDSLNVVDWEAVTIGELASHMGGIARDYIGDLAAATNTSVPGTPSCAATGPCSRSDFFKLLLPQPPVFPTSTTPVYSNIGYQLLSYALEKISYQSYPTMLQNQIIKPLNLSSTSYYTPPAAHGVIPGNATSSGWNLDYGDFTPVGGIYSSSNDLSTLGRSILTSRLLSAPLTRRWMKPRTFTSNPLLSVGAPWEIYRLQLSSPNAPRIVDLYTKSGDLTFYHSNLVLFPDWDIGFVVLEADYEQFVLNRNVISDMVAEIFLPAVEIAAREEAGTSFAGKYADQATNSSVVVRVGDGVPGLGVPELVLGGVDYVAEVLSQLYYNPSIRLYPSGLEKNLGHGDVEVGWRAVFESNTTLPDGLFDDSCATWFNVDGIRNNGFGIDDFTFTVGEDGKAKSITSRGFNVTLSKV
ncbi:beta-lactamase/transpeptidase-like protein [Mollisia scopiformis]|uniref:Beta-lactamase/transpeptidase-like protein n=1 Tax=Mollisia scopiformis TaxID=149040 RepID=A0A132B892_MOLSC|nr:beta-lactamase/transpeptidase-like protein [Mollisia scopiformis]KUJ08209.1 beta-lactamase/transpeptidase-like protein [Mollisia scopiformis]